MRILNIHRYPQVFLYTLNILPFLGALGVPVLSNYFFTVCCLLYNVAFFLKSRSENIENKKKSDSLITFFLFIAAVGVVRGVFVADNYWEYKQLLTGTLSLSLPLSVYVFRDATILRHSLYYWLKYFLPLFLIVGIWTTKVAAWHFAIPPIFLLGCFLPIIKSWKIKVFIIFLLVLMLVGDLGARTQIMKSLMVMLIAIGIWLRKFIPTKILHAIWLFFLVLPIVLLLLGITGRFNVFQYNSINNEGKYTQTKMVDGEYVVADVSADTRTFIYEEVIGSALKNNYVFWGRTPARGNDSDVFGALSAEDLKTGKYERYMNEVCHPNVFTWLGLLGLIPWCLIYVQASWLALFRSCNVFMRYIGVFIAFRFLLGWIEDMNHFNISGISVWMFIAMGYSEQFRRMTNQEFKAWVNGCLPFRK